MFTVDCSDSSYTGDEIAKEIVSPKLLEGTDFVVEYSNNLNVGIASIDITGVGRAIGSLHYVFNIVAETKPPYEIPGPIGAIYGQALGELPLPEGFSWQDGPATAVGEPGEHEFMATYTPTDPANYETVRDIPVKVCVTRAIDASMFAVDAAGLTYDGSAHEPAVSSGVVPEGSYSVAYRDNVAAGEATAVVTGSGFYSGSCELKFSIAKARPAYEAPAGIEAAYGQALGELPLPEGFSWQDGDITVDWYGDAIQYATFTPKDETNYNSVFDIPVSVFGLRNVIEVPVVDFLTYNGSVQIPNFENLPSGVGVALCDEGKNAGVYQVVFALADSEIDRWADGTSENKTVEYRILPRDINEIELHVGDSVLVDGAATPDVEASYNGQTLVSGIDFDVSYESNESVGMGVAVVSGKGNYTGTERLSFRIGVANIAEGVPQIYDKVFVYKGVPVTPRVYLHVGNSGVSLREGIDYTVEYSDNDAVGTGKAILYGIGDYIGTLETTFNIVDKIDLSDANLVTVSAGSIAFYTGSAVEPGVDARCGRTNLVQGVDYEIRYENNVNEGAATAIVTGMGDYTGEVRVYFRIVNASVYNLTNDGSAYLSGEKYLCGGNSFLLVGSKVEPSVSVALKIGDSWKSLTEGVDYTVSYSNNTSAGTGYVTIRGINGLSGSITKSFKIVNSLDVATLGIGYGDFESDEYLAPAKPKLLPSDNFVENVDYWLSYEGCDKEGLGSVTIHGKGRYTGTTTAKVRIVNQLTRSSLYGCSIDAIPAQVYTGNAIVPDIVVRDSNGRVLDSGLEYSVHVSDNTNVGTAKVTACMGAGAVSYSGYLQSSFVVEPANINSIEVSGLEDKDYTGKPITQSLDLEYNGKQLVEGRDYSVEYSNNTKIGTASLKIVGMGNFTGEKTLNFKINPVTMKYDYVLTEGVTCTSTWNGQLGSTSFRIDLPQGGLIDIGTAMEGVNSVVCGLYDSNGEVLYAWSPGPSDAYGTFALPAGTYYFEVLGSTNNGYALVGAQYRLIDIGAPDDTQYEVEPNSPSDDQAIPEVATKVEMGKGFAGSFYNPLGAFDLDYYEFTLTERAPVSLDIVTGKSLMFAIVDKDGNILSNPATGESLVVETPDSSDITRLRSGVLEAGTYYVVATSKYASSNGWPYYCKLHEDLGSAIVAFPDADLEYTGAAVEPNPVVYLCGLTLREGSDYYVEYDNNVVPGKAAAMIVGIGRFAGSVAYVNFDIVKSAGNYIALPGHWAGGSGGWWYPYDNGGYPANEWCIIDGSYYHFDPSGWMQTGWLKSSGTWYYLTGSGAMATGWQSVGGTWYWFDDSGAMAAGWRLIDSTYYFFDGSGSMATGWLNRSGTWYWLDGSGAMATGWRNVGGAWYWFDDSGAMATGWRLIDGTYYFFDGSGSMQAGKWVGDYYLLSSGAMATDQWIGVYYVGSDGRWVRGA